MILELMIFQKEILRPEMKSKAVQKGSELIGEKILLSSPCHRKKRLQVFCIWNETYFIHSGRTRAESFHGFGVNGNNDINIILCERSSL